MTRSCPVLAAHKPKRATFALLLTLAGMAVAQPPAHAEEPGAVAILHMQLPPEWQARQKLLEKKVKIALRESGFEVQARTDTQTRLANRSDLLSCAAEACMPEAGKVAKVDQLLRASLATTKDLYSVNLELFDAADGKSLATHETSCHKNDPCPPIADGWAAALRALGEKAKAALAVKTEALPVKSSPVVVATEPVKDIPRITDVIHVPQVHPTQPREDEGAWKRPVLWGGVAAGIALVGLGGYWWSQDGEVKERRPIGNNQFEEVQKATKTRGIIAVAGGAILAGGSALLLWQSPSKNQTSQDAPQVSVHVLPGGVSVTGSF